MNIIFIFLPDHPKFDCISNKCYCPFVKQNVNYYSTKGKTPQLIPKNKLKSFVNNNMFYLMNIADLEETEDELRDEFENGKTDRMIYSFGNYSYEK